MQQPRGAKARVRPGLHANGAVVLQRMRQKKMYTTATFYGHVGGTCMSGRAEPSRAEPSRAESSRVESSRVEPVRQKNGGPHWAQA